MNIETYQAEKNTLKFLILKIFLILLTVQCIEIASVFEIKNNLHKTCLIS